MKNINLYLVCGGQILDMDKVVNKMENEIEGIVDKVSTDDGHFETITLYNFLDFNMNNREKVKRIVKLSMYLMYDVGIDGDVELYREDLEEDSDLNFTEEDLDFIFSEMYDEGDMLGKGEDSLTINKLGIKLNMDVILEDE